MSRKRTTYTAEFKTKLVLEVLREEKTLTEIASANNITPKNLQNWKKIFLENAEVAMEPAKAVKEYKDEVAKLKVEVGEYAKKVGQLTLEKEWAVGKSPRFILINNDTNSNNSSKFYSILEELFTVPDLD